MSYSCGATIEDSILPDTPKSVGIQSHDSSDPIEKIFYSAYKDDLICIHCGSSNDLTVPVESDTFIHTVQTVRCLNAFTNASLCNVQL